MFLIFITSPQRIQYLKKIIFVEKYLNEHFLRKKLFTYVQTFDTHFIGQYCITQCSKLTSL